MNKQKRKFFDDLAGEWDDLFYKDTEINRKMDKLILNYKINQGSRILDLGCGTGVISSRLAELTGRKGKVVGCDYSLAMLKTAGKKARGLQFICADARRLPFQSASFENVVCFSCFPHFEDKQEVLKEMHRIIKEGGHLIISHLLSSREISRVHRRVKGAVVHDKIPTRRWMRDSLKNSGFKILSLLDKAGLYLLQAEKISGNS